MNEIILKLKENIKKVIVGKVKLCSRVEVDHDKRPPDTLAVDIIPPVVE